jgi:hypothetical protein
VLRDVECVTNGSVTRDSVMNIRLPTPIKEAARRAAQDDGRSLSGMVTRIMREWLSEHGYLDTPEVRSAKKEKR